MSYKWIIGSLAICTLAGCADNSGPIVYKVFSPYQCSGKVNSEYTLNMLFRVKPKTSQTIPDFKMAPVYFKGSELYEVDVSYHIYVPPPRNSNLHATHSVFDYDNIDFEYDNKDLILKIPEVDTLPACQIRFKKGRKTGKQTCEFENNDAPHRATTFKLSCLSSGKIGTTREEDL